MKAEISESTIKEIILKSINEDFGCSYKSITIKAPCSFVVETGRFNIGGRFEVRHDEREIDIYPDFDPSWSTVSY